tara:strand:- start:653 stop:1057 length:405 start_codon:yes stop_codon:yes gene_type:complete
MLEILGMTVNFLGSLIGSLLGIVLLCGNWAGEVLYSFHVNAPRLEGLVIGVLLAWLLSRKDRHPILKLVSAPLRLVIDILDIAWDQAVEFLCDTKDVLLGWLRKGLGIPLGWLKSAYKWVNIKLENAKSRLLKK